MPHSQDERRQRDHQRAAAKAAWTKVRGAFPDDAELRELIGLLYALDTAKEDEAQRRLLARGLSVGDFLEMFSDPGYSAFCDAALSSLDNPASLPERSEQPETDSR